MSYYMQHLPVLEQQHSPSHQMLGHSATFGEDTVKNQDQQQLGVKDDSFRRDSSASGAKRSSNARKTLLDLNKYKGNYAGDNEGKSVEVRYSCPQTGAHFKFDNMCEKLDSLVAILAEMEARQAAKHEAKRAEDEKALLSLTKPDPDIGDNPDKVPSVYDIVVEEDDEQIPPQDQVIGEDQLAKNNDLEDIKRRSFMRPVTALLDTTSKRTSNAEVPRISFLKSEGNQIIFKNDLAIMTIIEEFAPFATDNKINEKNVQHDSHFNSRDFRETEVINKPEGDDITHIAKESTLNNETLLRDNSGNFHKSLLQQDVGDPSFVVAQANYHYRILHSSGHFQKYSSEGNENSSNRAHRYVEQPQKSESIISIIAPEPNFKRSSMNPPTELIGDNSNIPKDGDDITMTQEFLIESSASFTRAHIPEKYKGSLLELQTGSNKQTEKSVKIDAHIQENNLADESKPIDPFLESSIRQGGGGSMQSILAPSSQDQFDQAIIVEKGLKQAKRSSAGQANQAPTSWDIKGASNINLTPKRGTCSLVHIVDDSRSPTAHLKRDTDQQTIDNQKSQESYQPVKVVMTTLSTVGFRKEQHTKNTSVNSAEKSKNYKGSFKSDAPLKINPPGINPFHFESTARQETDTQDTPLPQSDFSREKDVGLLKSEDVKEYLKNTRLMIKARQQQLSREMQLENTTVNIKALYDNKNLQKQNPYRNCSIKMEHRSSQHLSHKKLELENSINALTDEMEFNDAHQKRLLNTYKQKILDTEKDIAKWQKPRAAKIPFTIKRPTYNTYITKGAQSSPDLSQKVPYQRFFNASPFGDQEISEVNKRAADYALKALSKYSKNFNGSSPLKFELLTPSMKLEPIDECSINNSSQITPDYQKQLKMKPPRKPAPFRSIDQLASEGQQKSRTLKFNSQSLVPILQNVTENDRYSQSINKETKMITTINYGMNKQGQGSRPCSQSQLARKGNQARTSETQHDFYSRNTEHRQYKSDSNSVDFMMLSLGNLVAVPKVRQPSNYHMPNAHSLKIVGHYSDVPIESQQQSRDYNNFSRIANVPLLHMQPPKGNAIKSRHRAHERGSYHYHSPALYSDKMLSYQSSLNTLFF